MAITLPPLTGNKEIAANAGHAKIKAIYVEILALDTQLKGAEDPEVRAEHDEVQALGILIFLWQCLKRGFKQWLADAVYRKGDLLRQIDDQEALADAEGTQGDIQGDQSEVDGIGGGLD